MVCNHGKRFNLLYHYFNSYFFTETYLVPKKFELHLKEILSYKIGLLLLSHRLCLVTNLGLLRIYTTDSLQKLEFVVRYQTNKKLKIESAFNFDEGTICGCQVSLHHVFVTENQYLSYLPFEEGILLSYKQFL